MASFQRSLLPHLPQDGSDSSSYWALAVAPACKLQASPTTPPTIDMLLTYPKAMVATQNALPPSMIAVSLAFLIFIQNLAASVFSVVTNTIFEQTLISKLPEYAPSVSPKAALNAGGSAEAVRALVPMGGGHELDGVLKAYSDALRNLWYLLVGFAVAAFLFGWGTGWKDVRKKDVEGEQPDDNKIAEEGEGSEDVEKGKV